MATPEIVYLLQKYKDHSLTTEEFNILKRWVLESEENKLYMANFIRFYKIEERWEAYNKANPQKAWKSILAKYHHKKRIRRQRMFAVAACTILFVIIGGVYKYTTNDDQTTSYAAIYPRQNKKVVLTLANGQKKMLENGGELICESTKSAAPEQQYNTISTQVGGNFKLILPDKSIVWLNSNTTLRYPVKFAKDRHVILSGEAFFDVQKTGYPFSVEVNENKIRVLGTQFDVSAYNGKAMLTTLVRGKVEVSNRNSKQILHPNQQASIAEATQDIVVKEVNTTIYTSWIQGVFEFESTPLTIIMEQLAQWYDIDVTYQNEQMGQILFTGSLYRDRSLDYTLQIIQDISDVKFRNEKGKLCVYR